MIYPLSCFGLAVLFLLGIAIVCTIFLKSMTSWYVYFQNVIVLKNFDAKINQEISFILCLQHKYLTNWEVLFISNNRNSFYKSTYELDEPQQFYFPLSSQGNLFMIHVNPATSVPCLSVKRSRLVVLLTHHFLVNARRVIFSNPPQTFLQTYCRWRRQIVK